MPCYGEDPIDWRKMYKCRGLISKQMIAAGWNPHAKKFREVMQRKADKLYRQP